MAKIKYQQMAEHGVISQACEFKNIEHHLHSPYTKNIIERTIQYLKERTETLDDYYFPCCKDKCRLKHIINWLNLFIDHHNKKISTLS